MDLARYDELLSAYFDRELSPDERAAVDRLLEKSDEARERLRELQVTSRFMRNLPQHQLTVDFADNVIDRLHSESLLRPEPIAPKPTIRRNVWWYGTPLAAAATLLFALGIWNYQDGNRNVRPAAGPFDHGVSESVSSEPLSAVARINQDQWEAGDVLEIRGPTGEKQFELLVLAMAAEPNTIKCSLAESRDPEPSKSAATEPAYEPAVAQGGTTLAIEADQKHLDQFKELLAQSNNATGAAFPLVDIVTDREPERIRVAAVGPQTRAPGRGGNQVPLAEREAGKRDADASVANLPKDQATPAFEAKQLSQTADTRRTRIVAQSAAQSPGKDSAAGESASLQSETAQPEKKAQSVDKIALKSAAALQNRGQRVPRITEMKIQQTAGEPATTAASTAQRSTAGHVETLAKSKRPEQPGIRPARPNDKEPPGRRIEVLLIIRNDRPE